MQTLLTILTALSLGAHAMAGCCWHHARECACDALSDVASTDAESCCQHCQQAETKHLVHAQHSHKHHCNAHPSAYHNADELAHDESTAPPSPCQCKLECHGTCTYLPPEKSPLDSAADGPTFAQPVIALLDDSATVLLSANWEWLANRSETAQPLRIHLLHQVFLI